jgi:hypothetical protein
MIPLPNPFDLMGSVAGRIVVDGWTAVMLAVWNAGLWVLRLVLGWVDSLLTPDLSETGPAADLYPVTFWLAGALLMIMMLVQLGISAWRRDGRGLANALVGLAQFAIVWAAWIGYTVAVIAACSSLTRSLMESLLNVTSWNSWQPWEPINPKDVTDAATATVLGVLGVLLWVAAIAHVLVMLTRAAAVMVIVATTPIAAAGLTAESTKAWFWKAFRWFHAAALTPPLVVIVTGIGIKFASGVAAGQASGVMASIATAFPAVVLICIASFSPLALFKLLAFVDPGTASGAAMRAGMAAAGGVQGLLRGNPSATTNDQAAASDDSGRSAGESTAEAATSARVAGSVASGMSILGPAGAFAAASLGAMAKLGTAGAAMGADITNQAGIGHNSYYPDYTGSGGDGARANREAQPAQPAEGSSEPAPSQPNTLADTPTSASTGATGSAAGAPAASGGTAAAGSTAAEAAIILA